MELGERITAYRKQAGLTIAELAGRAGVSVGALNKVIGGKTVSPSFAMM